MAGFAKLGTTEPDFYRGSATGIPRNNTKYPVQIYISTNISSRFFKTNLSKCAVVWVKKRQKGRFRKTEKLQNHSNEEKGSKGEKERARRWKGEEKKGNGCTLSFIMATLEIVFGRKNCWTQKVNLARTLSKIRLDTYICICIQERNEKKN